jgi:hypothetical protein
MIIKLNGDVVNWSSKKQKSPATSTTEAEYIAMSNGSKEILWLQHLLIELGLEVQPQSVIYCDNQPAVAISKDNMHHEDTKHIDTHYHFVRYHIRADEIRTQWIDNKYQQADVLTKALDKQAFEQWTKKLMSR